MKITVTMDRNTLVRMICIAAYSTSETLRNTGLNDPKYESRKKECDFFADLDEAVLENNWDDIVHMLGIKGGLK